MADTNDTGVEAKGVRHSGCTEFEMRDTLANLEEFALMMCYRSSIHGMEILEVIVPAHYQSLTRPAGSRPADIITHPAVCKHKD